MEDFDYPRNSRRRDIINAVDRTTVLTTKPTIQPQSRNEVDYNAKKSTAVSNASLLAGTARRTCQEQVSNIHQRCDQSLLHQLFDAALLTIHEKNYLSSLAMNHVEETHHRRSEALISSSAETITPEAWSEFYDRIMIDDPIMDTAVETSEVYFEDAIVIPAGSESPKDT